LAFLEYNEKEILFSRQYNMANIILLYSEKKPPSIPRLNTNLFLKDLFND
jgi:hypothetical protein